MVRTRLTEPQVGAQVPDAAQALADTCVRHARQSCDILIESWTNGALMIFDYFDTQHMFSSATILAMSVARGGSIITPSDRDRLECIEDFLSQLKGSGNFAAAEFHQHISAITILTGTTEAQLASDRASTADLDAAAGAAAGLPFGARGNLQGHLDDRFASEITTGDPLFFDLLAQPATDLQFIDDASFADVDFGLSWYNTEI